MGNNQTAFYNGLDYGYTNDSGYFDDELTYAAANVATGDDGESLSNADELPANAQYDNNNNDKVSVNLNMTKHTAQSAHVLDVTKRMTKSKSIEIASTSLNHAGLTGSLNHTHRRRVQSTISDIEEEEQTNEDDADAEPRAISESSTVDTEENDDFYDDHDDHDEHESDVFGHDCTCDKCNRLNSTIKNNHKQNFDVYSVNFFFLHLFKFDLYFSK